MHELKIYEIKGNLVTDSRQVAEMTEVRHADLLEKIKSYVQYLTNGKFRWSDFFIESTYLDGKGEIRPCYLITRKGCDMIANKMTGEKGVLFTAAYINKFYAMEDALRERQSTDWLKTREHGKLIRRYETDVIKDLIPYAQEQGSKNTGKFYLTYSKLVNKTAGIESGQRDRVSYKKLMLVALLEDMVTNTIQQEMKKGVYYKNIYQICKNKAEQFAGLLYISA